MLVKDFRLFWKNVPLSGRTPEISLLYYKRCNPEVKGDDFMTEPQRPPRSLRGESGPRLYRDWSAADAVLNQDAYTIGGGEDGDHLVLHPQEMHMLDDLETEEAEEEYALPTANSGPVYAELPPLPVIQPAEAPSTQTETPKEKSKMQITRVNKPTIQRARRYDALQAEEEQKRQEEAAAAEKTRRQQAQTQAAPLTTSTGKTSELKHNLKEITHKIDETAENVRSTADSLSENIKGIGDKIALSLADGIKKASHQLMGILGRWRQKSDSHSDAATQSPQDFEDAPLPATSAVKPVTKTELNLLDAVPPVPAVAIAPLLREGMSFLSLDKHPLPTSQEGSAEQIQTRFIAEAIADIQHCIKLVQKLPAPEQGPYRGIPISYLFKHIRQDDIYFFLHYVQAHPAAFKNKELKLAEAFANWVIKRSHSTVFTEPFPEVPARSYYPLYKQNVRFLSFSKQALVIGGGKSQQEVDQLFMTNALSDIETCANAPAFIEQAKKYPKPTQGPYKGRPIRQIFRNISEKDVYFFLHYVAEQPDLFKNQNFKFAEAFASWILQRSHETQLPRA
jgi:hypothetical protein